MAADVGYGSGESLDATLRASGSETIQLRSKAEVLAGSVKGGVLTDFKTQADIRTAIEKSNALRYIDQLRITCQNKTDAFENATIERNEQRTQLRALDTECQDCQEEILALQRAVPIELKRRNQETILKKRFEAARVRVEQQRSVLEATEKRHNLLNKEIDELQLELSRSEAVELDLRAEKAVSVYEQRIKADESLLLRKRTEQRLQEKSREREREKAEQQFEEEKLEAKQQRDAHSAKRKTRLRLVQDLQAAEQRKVELDEFIKEDHMKRAQALMQLKHSTEDAQADMLTEMAPKLRAVRQREQARAQERRELDAAGRNPDAIFAVRDEAARMKNRAARLKANTLKQELRLLDQLIVEDDRARKVAEVERNHEEHLSAYRAINGPSIISKFVRDNISGKEGAGRHGHDASGGEGGLIESGESPSAAGRGGEGVGPAVHFEKPGEDYTGEVAGGGEDDEKDELEDDHGVVEPRHIPIAWNEHRRVLQKRKVAAALERQQQRLREGEPRDVCGKTYTTSKFLSQPARIEFKDFLVGRSYKQKVVLTNVSFAFNSFKLLALPDAYTDYFEIIFTPPGRMSAGTTNSLTVIFKPKMNEDIITELPLLAETGPFSIPLVCYTRKAVISVSPRDLDLGQVVLGDSDTQQIVVTNAGKLTVPFTCRLITTQPAAPKAAIITTERTELLTEDAAPSGPVDVLAEQEAESTEEVTFEATGTIGGYTNINFPVTFTPSKDGEYTCRLQFDFGTEAERAKPVNWGSDSSFTVDAKGLGCKVPVYADKDVVDFQNCVSGKLYRKVCRLCNRSLSALKCTFSVPKALHGFVSFTPAVGFIQKRENMDVQVRFNADLAVLEQIKRYYDVGPEGNFEVPVTVIVAGQTLPVVWRMKCRLATGKIKVSQSSFDFGRCFITHSAMMPITITNDSPFLQKVAFISMPREVEVQPSSGYVSILPFRSVIRNVMFSPKAAAEYEGTFKIQTKLGDKVLLRYKGEGMEAPFGFSESELHMGPVPDGDYGVISTYVTNTSKKVTRTLEFCVPPDPPVNSTTGSGLIPPRTQRSFITISPKVLVLRPEQRARVEVLFAPKVAEENKELAAPYVPKIEIEEVAGVDEDDPKGKGKAKKKKGDPSEDDEAEAKLKAEEKEEQKRLAIEAKMHEWEQSVALARKERTQAKDQQQKECPTNTMALSDHVVYSDEAPPYDADEPWSRHAKHCIPCVVKSEGGQADPILFMEVNTTVVLPALAVSPLQLDFGQITPGTSTIKSVELKNQSGGTLDLTVLSLSVNSPFTLLNVLRPLAPGQAHYAVFEFAPRSERNFTAELIMRAGNCVVNIPLLGKCVSPRVTVEPADSVLDLGDVLSGDTITRDITVTNISSFTFNYKLEKIREQGERNVNGMDEFFFVPGESSVPAEKSQVIALNFSPDHPSTDYHTYIQLAENEVLLRGRCHPRQMYIWAEPLPNAPKSILSTEDEDLFVYQNPLDMVEVRLSAFTFDGQASREAAPASDKAAAKGGKGGAAAAPAQAAGTSVVENDLKMELVFTDPVGGAAAAVEGPVLRSRKLHVGACVLNDTSRASAGSFEFKFVDANPGYWGIDPTQRQLKGGDDFEVGLTFNLTQYNEHRVQEALGNEALLLVGQWVEIRGQFQLKGGYVPPGLDPIKTVDVLLRTFVDV